MRIRWSLRSLTDRENILEWNAQFSPKSAVGIDNRIEESVSRLANFPSLGRAGRFAGTRELVVSDTRCIVIYQVSGTEALILRVLHGSQELPREIQEV
jgi:toxin ParE1/3/4